MSPAPRASVPRYAQAFALALLALAPSRAQAALEGAPAPSAAVADGTASVTLRLTVAPRSDAGASHVTRVTLDGRPAALDVPIEVSAGSHVVRLEIEDRPPSERAIVVRAGDRVELALDGELVPTREPPTLGGAPPPVQHRGGCAGCGGSGDASSARLGVGSLALGVVVAAGRRRRRESARGRS